MKSTAERNILAGTMAEMTWPQVAEKAARNAVVFLPVGVIEEHSRHLPCGTDIYVATAQSQMMAEAMEARGHAAVVAPPFWWGMIHAASHRFAGSFTCRAETMEMLLDDIFDSLAAAGFTRVVLCNCHGDGHHCRAIKGALGRYNERGGLQAYWQTFEDDLKHEGMTGEESYCLAVPPYDFGRLFVADRAPSDPADIHAGAAETAIMRVLFPELVDLDEAALLPATDLSREQVRAWAQDLPGAGELAPFGHVGAPAEHLVYTDVTMRAIAEHVAEGMIAFFDAH